jgi:hypothetical protein
MTIRFRLSEMLTIIGRLTYDRNMTSTDHFDRIAALVYPIDFDTATARTGTPDEDADADHARADHYEAVLAARADFAENLRRAADADVDPLLAAIEQFAAARDAADAKVRHLIAYAREFLPKRSYTLEELARAAGMSTSGVDTAYGRPRTTENPVIRAVAEATGILPRDERVLHYFPTGAGKTRDVERALIEALTVANTKSHLTTPADSATTAATDRALRAFADSLRPGGTGKTAATMDVQNPTGVIPNDIDPPAAPSIDLLTSQGRQAVLERIARDHQDTLNYHQQLQALAERFEADVRSLDWEQEVAPVSNAALEHLLRSGRYNNAVSSRDLSLESDLAEAGVMMDALDSELAALRNARRDAAHDATKLQTLIMHLCERFRAAQDTQQFTPPSTDTNRTS